MSKADVEQVDGSGGGAPAQRERELDTIPEQLHGKVICWDGRPMPGESSARRMAEGRIENLHPFTQLRIATKLLGSYDRAARALRGDDKSLVTALSDAVKAESARLAMHDELLVQFAGTADEHAQVLQEKVSASVLKSPFVSAAVCDLVFVHQALGWWQSKMAHSNANKPTVKSPVTASVHTIHYQADDLGVTFRVYHIGTMHHISIVQFDGDIPAGLRRELATLLTGLNGGDADTPAIGYSAFTQNCVTITSQIMDQLAKESGAERRMTVNFPWEIQGQLASENKKLMTLKTEQHEEDAFVIIRNVFGKPEFIECENDASGLRFCLRAYLAKRQDEVQMDAGDVKLAAAAKVLAYFSGKQPELLSVAEVDALRNSRLQKIIEHYEEHGEERLQTHLGLLLERERIEGRPWRDTRQVRASATGMLSAGKEDITDGVYADLLFGN